MRSALLIPLALVISTPAFAQDSKAQHDLDKMADTLNSPVTQEVAAAALGQMMAAVLDIRVDQFAKALEPLNGGKPVKMKGRTLRDYAERDDPDFERKMQDGTRRAVGSAGAMTSAMAAMLPQLEQAVRKMKASLPQTH